MNKQILIIDDDQTFLRLVDQVLTNQGYKVLTAGSGQEGLRLLFAKRPDLVLLDVSMPGMDGWETCQRIREISETPVIMLTGKQKAEEDVVHGLNCGADEYLFKPVRNRELAARVRAVLRRLPGDTIERGTEEIRCGELAVNFLKHEASLAGSPLSLSPIEFKLLGVLVKEPERVFSRAELIDKALGYDFEGFDRTIDVHILNLRRKLEPDPNNPRYIKTVYGIGYKFIGGIE